MDVPVRLEVAPPLARVVLDRPPVNVLDLETIELLDETLGSIAGRADLSVIVLESAVDGVFSAGVDVKDHVADRARRMLSKFHSVFRHIDSCDAFIVAAVDGPCLGGGCELLEACDAVLATERSTFAHPETDLGCLPPVACALLGRRVGPRLALSMILTGSPLTAMEAKGAGLVNRVCGGPSALREDLRVVVDAIARKSVPVVRAAKRAFRAASDLPAMEGLSAAEEVYLVDLLPLEDMAEGVKAFLEKRSPRWRNR